MTAAITSVPSSEPSTWSTSDKLRQDIAARRQAGEVVGIGIASCVEVSGGGSESGVVTRRKTARCMRSPVRRRTGRDWPRRSRRSSPMSSRFRSRQLPSPTAIPVDGPRGGGTMGSRSLQLGGNALRQAAQEVRAQLLQAAGHEDVRGCNGRPGAERWTIGSERCALQRTVQRPGVRSRPFGCIAQSLG